MTPESACLLGVDGGNTKTIALIARPDGRIIGAGRGGCSDIYNTGGTQGALEQLERAISTALTQAGLRREDILSGCFSMAGADWPEDYAFLRDAFTQRGFGRLITVYNDALGSLRAGSPDGTGVVIACGTGGAIAARNAEGVYWHSSFWNESVCGRELGILTLRAIWRAELEMEPPTTLTNRVLAHFNESTVENMLHRFTSREKVYPSDIEISRIAPLLLDEAHAEDPTAQRIVEAHGAKLAAYALVAARKVGIHQTPFRLVLNGGIFRHHGRLLVDAITHHILQAAPGATLLQSRFEPAVGALLFAFEAAQLDLTPEVMAQLESSLPHTSLYQT